MEDYTAVWCEWAEMEIRNKKYAEALAVMQQAVTEPPRRSARQQLTTNYADIPVRDRVHRSVKLWALYIDLEVRLAPPAPLCRVPPVEDTALRPAAFCRNRWARWLPPRPHTTERST